VGHRPVTALRLADRAAAHFISIFNSLWENGSYLHKSTSLFALFIKEQA
jgi:hypothetical protein